VNEVRLLRKRKGIVGIEAAIVLIAFVVIAAALSYVVINMGFFATQKTKETIAEGIAESTAALMLDGTVTAKTSTGTPMPVTAEPVGTTDGSGDLTGTLANSPVVENSVTMDDGTNTYMDDGAGILTGAPGGSGTIVYATGEFTITGGAATAPVTADYEYIGAGKIEHIVFPVKLSVGKAEVDLGSDSVVVSVYLPGSTLLDIYASCTSTDEADLNTVLGLVAVDSAEFRIYNGDADTVLESKEKAFLVVHLNNDKLLGEYETVKIEVKTGRGAALTVVRTAPGGMSENSYVDLG